MPRARRLALLALTCVLACAHVARLAAQEEDDDEANKLANRVLNLPALSGQSMPIFPLGAYVLDTTALRDSALQDWRTRQQVGARFDALLATYFTDNAPDVRWIGPAELRRIAKRAPGMLVDPDRVGLQQLAPRNVKRVPDPLSARLRQYVALTDARAAFCPVLLGMTREYKDGVAGYRADLTAVVVDARLGDVRWRSNATGRGRTPEAALRTAIATMVPPELTAP
ncbi:MAG: hypothetical protein MUC69_04195 [Gemmatimonadales bacterium]|nr:hypothetical protein [Gemmatimonadales bacterium]